MIVTVRSIDHHRVSHARVPSSALPLRCLDTVTVMAQSTPMLGVVGILTSEYQGVSVHWVVVCVYRPVLAAQGADGVTCQHLGTEAGLVCPVVATLA